MPPTLFIDLDGTIMRNPFWPVIFPAIGAHLAGKTGLNSAAIIDMIVAENRRRISEHGDATLAMDWDDIVQTVAARLGVTCELSAEQLNNDHASPPDTAILDDADQVLQAIKEMGWQIVAATHGLSRYQVPVLRALGLLSLFTDVAAPDTRGRFKQQRAFWLPYLDTCRPLVHCGDLYEDDVLSAISFGIRSVWKTTPDAVAALPAGSAIRPDVVIYHLRELVEVLGRMGRG